MSITQSPSAEQAARHFDSYFSKILNKQRGRPLQIRVVSKKTGLDYAFPSDSTNQPYHLASIGKVFTAVLVQKLARKGLLSIQDELAHFFSASDLAGLFVYRGVDYARQVTVEQLLGHTSGIADYFEGKTRAARPFIDQVLSNPQIHWTPQMLLDFTRQHQTAVGIPGSVFHYSDSGYILLGLLIETLSGKTFAQNLNDEIFLPLEMHDSYLMFAADLQTAPRQPIQEIWFNGVEISRFESLSCDWSGGGIVSTTADLLKFSQALRGGGLVQERALQRMDTCTHKFRPGIYYGLGMMEIRFQEFFFLLGRLPRVKGHIGILSTHMFYDPRTEAHILMNFGDNTRMVESFQALIEIENMLYRMV